MTLMVNHLTGFGASNGFSPADLSPFLWLEARIENLFQDAAGTTPVAASNDPVGLVRDLSGNNRNASQATNSKRPLYSTASGYSLIFDGVDDALSVVLNLSGTNTLTAAAAYRPTADISSARIVAEHTANLNTAPANNGAYFISHNANETINVAARGTTSSNANQGSTTTATYLTAAVAAVARHSISGNLTSLRTNGVDAANATGTKGTGNFKNDTTFIGARGGTSLYMPMQLHALIIYDRFLTDQETTNLTAYLAALNGAM